MSHVKALTLRVDVERQGAERISQGFKEMERWMDGYGLVSPCGNRDAASEPRRKRGTAPRRAQNAIMFASIPEIDSRRGLLARGVRGRCEERPNAGVKDCNSSTGTSAITRGMVASVVA